MSRSQQVTAALAALLLFGAGTAAAGARSAPRPATSSASQRLQAHIDAQIARSPGGKQISRNGISWRHGTVVMEFPQPGVSQAHAALWGPRCKKGWYCLFEHRDWGGRMLRFRDCGKGEVVIRNNLGDYGFANRASSWHNNHETAYVQVYDDGLVSPPWSMDPQSKSSWVGKKSNDKADYVLANQCPGDRLWP